MLTENLRFGDADQTPSDTGLDSNAHTHAAQEAQARKHFSAAAARTDPMLETVPTPNQTPQPWTPQVTAPRGPPQKSEPHTAQHFPSLGAVTRTRKNWSLSVSSHTLTWSAQRAAQRSQKSQLGYDASEKAPRDAHGL